MSTSNLPESENIGRSVELRHYIIGGILALILTLAAFGTILLDGLSALHKSIAIFILAILQIVVHFHFFLHIDLKKSHRDDLLLTLFTSLIVFLMVGGTIWILYDLHTRML